MADINVQFYQTKDSTAALKETDTTLTPDGKLPVASLEKEFEVKTLKEIRGGKAFLIGADEHGDSRNSFAGMTTIKVTGELKGKRSPDRVNPPGTLESLKEKMTAPSSFAKARESQDGLRH